TGRPATAEQLTSPGYWREHLRQAVQFATGIDSLHELGADAFLEIGPHPTLMSMGQRCRPDLQALWLPSLRRGRGDWPTLLDSLGRLYAHGLEVDWDAFHQTSPGRRIPLPTYPFQRQRYWLETTNHRPVTTATQAQPTELPPWLYRPVWRPQRLSAT